MLWTRLPAPRRGIGPGGSPSSCRRDEAFAVTDLRSPSSVSLPAADAHPQVRHWLHQLDELVAHMASDGWDAWARERARDVIAFFAGSGRQQRRDEELLLFPMVAGRGDAALDAKVERLLQDHGWLEENWNELVSQLRPIAEGFGGYDVDMLAHAAQVYAALWEEHLDLVERVIHPAARAAHHGPDALAAQRVALAAGGVAAEAP
jgi:hemerythrin-like domain-containing protein